MASWLQILLPWYPNLLNKKDECALKGDYTKKKKSGKDKSSQRRHIGCHNFPAGGNACAPKTDLSEQPQGEVARLSDYSNTVNATANVSVHANRHLESVNLQRQH